MLLNSDSFPGQDRSKLCMASKVRLRLCCCLPISCAAVSALLWCLADIDSCCAFHTQVPLGVVLCIPPFNYPVNLAVSKIAPALMAGNTVVIKPPTQARHLGICPARACPVLCNLSCPVLDDLVHLGG